MGSPKASENGDGNEVKEFHVDQNIWSLIGFAAVAIIVVGGLAFLSQHYTLDNIKSRTVGDGQYGTARWATKREIRKTFRREPFQPQLWRQ